jgi:hypothetical protein
MENNKSKFFAEKATLIGGFLYFRDFLDVYCKHLLDYSVIIKLGLKYFLLWIIIL